MSFKDIKGQDRAVSFLKQALAASKVAHAYIFFGPRGVGKRSVALNFAKALNCGSIDAGEPCGTCVSCRKIDNRNHPDIFALDASADKPSVKIDKIRELIKDSGFRPYEAKAKVYIIDGAELMTEEASNAILKTLEEPVSHSVIILLTDRIGRLFPTIRSRCEEVRFFPLKIDEAKDILTNQCKMDSLEAHILASLSSGSPGRALEYKESGVFDKRDELIKGLVEGKFFELGFFDDADREELKLYLELMLTWYRDILIAKAGADKDIGFVNIDRRDIIFNEAREMDFDKIDDIITRIISSGRSLDWKANPKLTMSVLGASIC